jgi:DnaJ family protein A protein 2
MTKLALTRNVLCSKCKGKGGKEGAVKTCPQCNGRGMKVVLRQMGPMIQQIQSPCDECSGTGEIMNAKDRCTNCKGKKILPEKKFLEVHIDKGMKGGQSITFSGESDQSPGAETGDVIIMIEEKPHERFKRQDTDLITEVELDLLTALGGGSFSVKHLDDHALVISISPGDVIKHGSSGFSTKSKVVLILSSIAGDVKVIHGQGMPSQRHHEPGDLYVKFAVKFPESIDPGLIPYLEKVLPRRQSVEKFPKNISIEDALLDEVDSRSRKKAERMQDGEPMDEDGGGEPRVQCANQ